MTPTVMRTGRYRLIFHSRENDEPPHIHVLADRCEAKYWLAPVALARNDGFAPHEWRRMRGIIVTNREYLGEVRHEFFDRDDRSR